MKRCKCKERDVEFEIKHHEILKLSVIATWCRECKLQVGESKIERM